MFVQSKVEITARSSKHPPQQMGKLTEFEPLAFAFSDVSICSIRPTLYLHVRCNMYIQHL